MAQAAEIGSPIVEQPAVELIQLAKRYSARQVLKDLCLSVDSGELMVILGESGCGKSTLFRLIAGLDTCDSGNVRIRGVEQAKLPPHKRDVAIVFQSGNGYENLSVRENLVLACKISSSGSGALFDEWVESLNLRSILASPLKRISGGEAQRVAIARAFLSGRSIVLFDEPLAHLNMSQRGEIRDLIRATQARTRQTVLYVTHDTDEALHLGTRIAVLADGRIHQVDTPRTLYSGPKTIPAARALGEPVVNVLRLPRSADSSGRFATDLEEPVVCGFRPNQWRLIQIDRHHDERQSLLGISMGGSEVVLRGLVQSCRWLGAKWRLIVSFPNPHRCAQQSAADLSVEISFTSPHGDFEDLLRTVENQPHSQPWEVQASMGKSFLLIFDDSAVLKG